MRSYLYNILDINIDTLTKSTKPSSVLLILVLNFRVGILALILYSFII